MRGNRCGIIEVLSRHTWREGGKSWRKRSHDNRGVPAEFKSHTFRICVYGCSVPATVKVFYIVGRIYGVMSVYNGCTYGRVSVFACCR